MEKPKVQAALSFLFRNGQVLLAMKKRGFMANHWNGYGGKPEEGDKSPEGTAIREIDEESGGVKVRKEVLIKVSEIDFYFPQKPEWNQTVHTFFVKEWEGEPQETEEMKPQWFDIGAIPYDKMWPADKLWLPQVILGQKIRGGVVFKDLDGNADRLEFEENVDF